MAISFEVAGLTWTFLSDPPPRMHLATPDRSMVVWLEDAGDRLVEPAVDSEVPAAVLNDLHLFLVDHRHEVEVAWLKFVMVPNGWIDAYLVEGNDVVVEAYAGTLNWFAAVVTKETMNGVRFESAEDVRIDELTRELVLGVEEERGDLAELLWGP